MIESVMVSGWHVHYTQSRMIRNVHTMTSPSEGQRGFQTTDHWRHCYSHGRPHIGANGVS